MNFLQGISGKTFQEYGQDIFLPYLKGQLESTSRVDVVWDTYRDDSLKSEVWRDRGPGTRRKVTQKQWFLETGKVSCKMTRTKNSFSCTCLM